MAQSLEQMLDHMQDMFDISFDDKSQKSSQGGLGEGRPKINPEYNSPQSSTNQDRSKESISREGKGEGKQGESREESFPEEKQVATDQIEMQCFSAQLITKDSNSHSQIDVEPLQLQQSGKRTLSPDKPIILDSESDNEDQNQLHTYRSLSQKLQFALNRIKRIPTQSSQFEVRQQEFMRRKRSDLDLLRAEKQKNQSFRCTGKPLINSKSTQLLNHYKPIQNRYKEVLFDKNKKRQDGIAEKKAKDAEKEANIIRDMKKHQKDIKDKLGNSFRTQQEYYSWMKTWTEVRDQKVQQMAFKQGQQSLKINTFKPNLNEKSQCMMKKKTNRVPIYEQEPKLKKQTVDKNCTFQPKITSKRPKKC